MNNKNKCDAEGASCHELLEMLEPIEGVPLNRDNLKVYLMMKKRKTPFLRVLRSHVSRNREGEIFNYTLVEGETANTVYKPNGAYCSCEVTLTKPLNSSGEVLNS